MKEFPKKEAPQAQGDFAPKVLSGISGKLSKFYDRSFGVIKFILGVCLLPLVYSSTNTFLKEFALIKDTPQSCFWAGIISFLIIYLFIWEPAPVYAKGHKLLELIFRFFTPLVKVAPYLLPIYTIVLFLLYLPLSLAIKSRWLVEYVVFLFGFTLALHLVFSAKSVRSKKGDFLKANYIFGFSFVWITNVMLLAFFVNLIFKEFSFVNFFNSSFSSAGDIFYAVFKQLFLR